MLPSQVKNKPLFFIHLRGFYQIKSDAQEPADMIPRRLRNRNLLRSVLQ